MPVRRHRRQFQQTDDFTRVVIIGLHTGTSSWSLHHIAAETGWDAITVSQSWSQEQDVNRRSGIGALKHHSTQIYAGNLCHNGPTIHRCRHFVVCRGSIGCSNIDRDISLQIG